MGGGQTQNATAPGVKEPIPSYEARPSGLAPEVQYNPIPQGIAPIWPLDGTTIDLAIYVSPSQATSSFKSMPAESLVLQEKGFTIGDWNDNREIDASFSVPKEVQNNGTLWAHFFVAISGQELDPTSSKYDNAKAYHFFRPLTQYITKKKVAKTKKLLGSSDSPEEPEEDDQPKGPVIASYYHPNVTVSVITDSGSLNYPSLHPAVRSNIQLETTGSRDSSGQNGWYFPIIFVNTFWQLRDHMTELNETVTRLPLHISLNNLKNWKFSVYASIDDNVKQTQKKAASGGSLGASGDGSEFEEFKRILIDTNIYLLSTTIVVSLLHTVFEMLAFKSDISHFRNKKDNVGISVRTILANVFMQTIIFLYLMDNNENTSWMILFGQGMGILIEAWKITKTVDVRLRPSPPGSFLPYIVTFEDKHKLSETEEKTKEYDEIAFQYLYWVAIPLLGAYAVYSLLYESHKSWYSFVITTLVGSVYAYGFLMMVPSLYINYRLKVCFPSLLTFFTSSIIPPFTTVADPCCLSYKKSVAHMPARAMTYKFLNTFIDDLFAWTIKMPTLHRLATLRDDLIFFVYLYQSWQYKVDYSRVNEFGQGGDDGKEGDGAIVEKVKEIKEGIEMRDLEGKERGEGSVKEVSGRARGDGGRKRK